MKSIGKGVFPDDTIISRPTDYHPKDVLTANMVRKPFSKIPKRKFKVPRGATVIDIVCFRNTNVKEVILPNSVKEIRWEAFSGCNNLEKIKLPASLESIGNCAFYRCKNLSSITL